MPRKKRQKIKFTEESVNDYMQEIYDESFKLNSKINMLFAKWEAKVKEGGEIAAMGDTIVKVITAMAKNQEQKIAILKILKDIVFVDSKVEGGSNKDEKINQTELQALADKAIKELTRDGKM
jgi:hypothetical protein